MPPHTTPRLEVRAPSNTRLGLAVRLPAGEARAIVLCGAEAIGTMRAHQRSGETLDWSENPVGDQSDDGMGWRINSYQPSGSQSHSSH